MQLIGALGPLIEARADQGLLVRQPRGARLRGEDRVGRVPLPAARTASRSTSRSEVVPAIRTDCRDEGVEVIATGASLGAFMAVAVACRYPWLFRAAVGMSGSYDLERLFGFAGTGDYYFATPMSFVPNLGGAAARHAAPAVRASSPTAAGAGRHRRTAGGWPACSGPRACRTASTPGGRSTTTTGRPGGRCCRSISTTWRAERRRVRMNVIFLEPGFPGEPARVRARARLGRRARARGRRPAVRLARRRAEGLARRLPADHVGHRRGRARMGGAAVPVADVGRPAGGGGRGARDAGRARARALRHPGDLGAHRLSLPRQGGDEGGAAQGRRADRAPRPG